MLTVDFTTTPRRHRQVVFQGVFVPEQGALFLFFPASPCIHLIGMRKFVFYIRGKFGRSERIRTSDPLLPKQVRYQAALRSDLGRGS